MSDPLWEAMSEKFCDAAGLAESEHARAELLSEDYAVLRAENAELERDLKIATESLRVMDSAADTIILCDACELCREHDGLVGE